MGIESYGGVEQGSERVIIRDLALGRFAPLIRTKTGEEIHGFNLRLYAVLQGVETWTLDEPGAKKRVAIQPFGFKECSGIRSRTKVGEPKEVDFEGHVRALFEEIQAMRDSGQGRDKEIDSETVEYLCGLFD